MNNVNNALPVLLAEPRPVWLCWDLYKTLCRATYPEPIREFQQILGYKAETATVSPDPEFLNACLTTASARVRAAFHNGQLVEEDPDEFAWLVASKFGLRVPDGAGTAFRQLILNEQTGISLFKDVRLKLRHFKQAGFKNALVSNTWPFPIPELFRAPDPEDQGEREAFDLGTFDMIVASYEVGHAKSITNPEFYREVVRRSGVHAGDCMMIGDNPDLDIRAAQELGMRAVIMDRYGDCKERIAGVPVISKMRHLYAPVGETDTPRFQLAG